MLITAIITVLGVSALTVLWKQRFRFVLAPKEYCMNIIISGTVFGYTCYISIDMVEGKIFVYDFSNDILVIRIFYLER